MKERPILFNSDMVRAILEDRKTQTRRVIKTFQYEYPWGVAASLKDEDGSPCFVERGNVEHLCPYGQVGSRLWVRETWAEQSGDIYYKADWPNEKPVNMVFDSIKWRPSIFMPRWASRITLEIVRIRAEKLQELTEEDAKAEGMTGRIYWEATGSLLTCARDIFQWYWDSLYAKRGYGWASNPLCWALEFKKLEREVKDEACSRGTGQRTC